MSHKDGFFREHSASHQIQFYLSIACSCHGASCTLVCHLQSIHAIPLSVITIQLSQMLLSHHMSIITESPTLVSLPYPISQCRKTENLFFPFFFFTWLFHPCWKSWTGAPNFSQENEVVCKCCHCKYTGSVFC